MSLLIAVTPRALPAASGQVRKAGMIIWLIFSWVVIPASIVSQGSAALQDTVSRERTRAAARARAVRVRRNMDRSPSRGAGPAPVFPLQYTIACHLWVEKLCPHPRLSILAQKAPGVC